MKYRILGVVLLLLILVVGATGIISKLNRETAQQLAERDQASREEMERVAVADKVGGKTPAETLAMLSDAVGSGDGPGAAALAVPALRDHIGSVVTGMTAGMRAETSRLLRESAESTLPPGGGNEFYVLTEPVYVELVRYPSGAWKVASF